jgi:HKD family nuclease
VFYNQPLAHRFGSSLATAIESEEWDHIEIAVAWVRRSGTQHLEQPFKKFLRNGGFAQITVGVDIENTSVEGLDDLLRLEAEGCIETHIYHNEATNTTFHPKVYLLRNDSDARLIVGSNNLTGAGLFLNTEAGLQLDAPVADSLISDARTALAAWRDTSTGFAQRLDSTLLTDMVRLGYVFPEKDLRQRRRSSGKRSSSRRTAAQSLFKTQRYSAPSIRGSAAIVAHIPGTVLLMRVRRASEKARRTQVQIPFKVVRTKFFAGISRLISAIDGRAHPLVSARARGGVNTIKIELPEIESMADPVLRLERTASAIVYQAFDASSVLGAPIRQALLNGFKMTPALSFSTLADLGRATWWRFI